MANDEKQAPNAGTEKAKPNDTTAESERASEPRCDWPPPYPRRHWGRPPYRPTRYCGPYGRPHHYGPPWWASTPPMPGSGIFEAMLHWAASSAASRQRWWAELAGVARHTRKAYWYGRNPCYDPWCDPYYDPWCDPSYDPWLDPCEPPTSCWPEEWCDPCDGTNIKDLKGFLGEFRTYMCEKLKTPEEKARFEKEVDEIVHCVKLARVTEAMRRKQWSRGKPSHR